MSKVHFLSRAAFTRLTTPTARACLRVGLTPDVVTILGTIVAVAGALTLFPMGKLFAGTCVVWFFVLFDMLDGAMARERGDGAARATWCCSQRSRRRHPPGAAALGGHAATPGRSETR